ncbi:MAG: methyltransferase [Thermoanaerobaculia bacterium]|nr:methyltransferase [Thermoanaerobaculia bacterium]
MASPPFRFKRFLVEQSGAAHPVGTDGVLLGAWADVADATRILDIGTGTGLVALMLAQRTENVPGVKITGVELQEDSFRCAQRNFSASPWAGRLSAVGQSVQDFAQNAVDQYDLIVSNPPFFTETIVSPDQKRQLSRTARALTAGDLLDAVGRLLLPHGKFCAIMPPAEGRRLCEWAALRGLYCTRETQVFARQEKPCERLLLQLQRDPYPMRRSRLYIYEREEVWSGGFRALTAAFYLYF